MSKQVNSICVKFVYPVAEMLLLLQYAYNTFHWKWRVRPPFTYALSYFL